MFFIICRIFLQNYVIMVIKNPCNFIGRRLSRYFIILPTLLVIGTVVVEYNGLLISEDHEVIHVTLWDVAAHGNFSLYQVWWP